MKSFLFLLLSILILYSCETNGSMSREDDTVVVDTTKPNEESAPFSDEFSPEEKEIINVATSFFLWYNESAKNIHSVTPTEPIVVEGNNGYSELNYDPYFNELRKLGTISEKFIESELERTRKCSEGIRKIAWEDYQNADAYVYEDICDFLYVHYWYMSHEAIDGIKVENLKEVDGKWLVTMQFYEQYNNEKHYNETYKPIVKVEKEDSQWLITEISFIDNRPRRK